MSVSTMTLALQQPVNTKPIDLNNYINNNNKTKQKNNNNYNNNVNRHTGT